jgi:ribosome-associated protein
LSLKTNLDKIVDILDSKKARDVSVINLKNISILADYFVVCTGTSSTHNKALADELEEKMKEAGVDFLHKEGYESARWILLDYGDIVVHIFHDEDRSFYNLERLWSDGIVINR